ncbi:hypothetical protein BCR33DRAFT_492424 [Rhizoclosmatium globosum]|uniref:Uncharacterized protein n=1 Tax=Rhizoclosmatium globosum TaxID=329046 RepID=A0A1Y2CUL4_9FUNG|nr:hypothetical protein BCR33DRAFT_492424 [Rhizoclosmatium globosum]|eukprot:ORY50703.1 hypothetical protein BCR33DRAFT_492424 [Rhizoclosmatium globosum]
MAEPTDLPVEEKELDAEFERLWGVNGQARNAVSSGKARHSVTAIETNSKQTDETKDVIEGEAEQTSKLVTDETRLCSEPVETLDLSHSHHSNHHHHHGHHNHNNHHRHHRRSRSQIRDDELSTVDSPRKHSLTTNSASNSSGAHTANSTRPTTGGLNTDFEDPTSYLEEKVFPILLPGIEKMLKSVKRKEELSDPLAWLGHYLQRHNINKHHPELPEKVGSEDKSVRRTSVVTQAGVRQSRKLSPSVSLGEVARAVQ